MRQNRQMLDRARVAVEILLIDMNGERRTVPPKKRDQISTRPFVGVAMSRHRVARSVPLLGALLALLGLAPTEHTLDFVVPSWMSITTGATGDTVIVLTAPTSTAPVGNCAPPGVYPMQDALIVDGKGQRLRTYLIAPVAYAGMPLSLEGVEPGTRIRKLIHLRTCQWGTKEFDYYRGVAD